MIKKFEIFESHLRNRTEFKISQSKPSLYSLEKLTDMFNNKNISFLELTHANVSIKQLFINDISDDNDYIIKIKPKSFELVKKKDITLSDYRIFKIYGLSDEFPSRYAIIPEIDFIKNIKYDTLNLNHLQRGDNMQERVFILLLSKISRSDVYFNNNVAEKYDRLWEEEIDIYRDNYPHNISKMGNQLGKIRKQIGYKFDIIYKDNSDFFINTKARELYNNNKKYRIKNYKFNKDKWNPSDIWIIRGTLEEHEKTVNNFRTLEELNSWLGDNIKNNENIIGISLKVNRHSKESWLDVVNMEGEKEPFDHKYIGYEYRPTNMTININYKWKNILNDKTGLSYMTIRNYSSGNSDKIGMEIHSNKGHMSGKLTGMLPSLFGEKYIDLQNLIIKSSNKDSIIHNIDKFELSRDIREDFIDVLLDDTKDYDYKEKSKLQGLLIANMIENHKNGSDWVINQMINYGRSQTILSAPYYILK